eukprot:3935754-Rhodomonas_salina.1
MRSESRGVAVGGPPSEEFCRGVVHAGVAAVKLVGVSVYWGATAGAYKNPILFAVVVVCGNAFDCVYFFWDAGSVVLCLGVPCCRGDCFALPCCPFHYFGGTSPVYCCST